MSRNAANADTLRALVAAYRARDNALFLPSSPETRDRIARRAAGIGHDVRYFEETDRLMARAREAITATEGSGGALPSGCVWWARSLSQAKGRMQRRWWAPPEGIYLCIAVYPSLLQEHWAFYNHGLGVAVAQILREWGVAAHVRWINDVLLQGRKVAGILSEAFKVPASGETYLLIGLGLNVNAREFPPELPEATSLSLHTGRAWPVAPLAAHIVARAGWIFGQLLEWEAQCLDADEGRHPPNPVVEAWRLASDTLGRRVLYGRDVETRPELEALAVDIARDGSLILELDSGERFPVSTGEIRYV